MEEQEQDQDQEQLRLLATYTEEDLTRYPPSSPDRCMYEKKAIFNVMPAIDFFYWK